MMTFSSEKYFSENVLENLVSAIYYLDINNISCFPSEVCNNDSYVIRGLDLT